MSTTPPLGVEVSTQPARLPERTRLAGSAIDIEPLSVEAHASQLWDALHGQANEHLWTYLPDGPFTDFEAFRSYLDRRVRTADPLFYAIVDKSNRIAVGLAALMRIEPSDRVIEVGHILYSPALQRTRLATEAMYLLARYIFEDLGYRRYEWKCHSLNQASRRAAQRLGFTFEGIFRQHRIIKGRNRDTAWFSMLNSEWPDRRAAFEAWLSPSNFHPDGHQKRSLAELNSPPVPVPLHSTGAE